MESGPFDERLLHGGIPSDDPNASPRIRVLVADLHRVIADTCTTILNASGFSAFSAHNVEDAVKIAAENAIDIALIELLIGEADAIDAAERILALRPFCRIVIWTGRSEPVLSWVRREAEEQFGGCDLLCKPIHPIYLLRIASGEPVPYECTILSESRNPVEAQSSEQECLSGSMLHEHLSEAREIMLGPMREGGEVI